MEKIVFSSLNQVGIAGGTASGKTNIAALVARELNLQKVKLTVVLDH